MALTRGQKAAAMARGGAEGGAIVATMGTVASVAMKGLARVAPAAAGVAGATLTGLAVAVPVAGAAIAAARSAKNGDSMGEVARHAALGAVGLDSSEVKAKTRVDFEMKYGQPNKLGGPKEDKKKQIDQRLEEIDAKFGGTTEALKKAIDNEKRSMKADSGHRDYHERRALNLEKQLIDRTEAEAKDRAPEPEKPKEGFGQRMLHHAEDAIENALFGKAKAKEEDALSKQRGELQSQIKFEREKAAKEYEKSPGEGPNQKIHREAIEKLQGQLGDVTAKQEAKEKSEAAVYRQMGALAAGTLIGGYFGHKVVAGAEKLAKEAAKDVERLAATASQLMKKNPNGVVAGTRAGDKIKAIAATTESTLAKPVVSSAQAYGTPAVIAAQAAVALGVSATLKDGDSRKEALQLDAAVSTPIAAWLAKSGVAARAIRPVVGPKALALIDAAENVVSREVRRGSEAVSKLMNRTRVSTARTSAEKTEIRGARDIAKAGVNAEGSVDRAMIRSAGDTGVARAKAASAVEVAEIRGKQAATRQMKRGQVSGYKDTWTVKRKGKAVIAHRKDLTVRTRQSGGAANDNSGAMRAAK